MANLFISCPNADAEIAHGLERRLKTRGHSFKVSYGSKQAGNWRGKLQNALESADAVIIVLTARAMSSPYVLGEVGMARIGSTSKSQLILPVPVGLGRIPQFVTDLQCFPIENPGPSELETLANQLHTAIDEHVHAKTRAPRIFISHRLKDEPVVAALVSLLESAFHLDKTDIRCTSVRPYALQPGARVSDRLKADLNGAELVLGVIGPETADSRYVLFELGSAWGRGAPTFPLLVRGATAGDVPGPLKEQHSISLDKVANCIQLVEDIAEESSLRLRKAVGGRIAEDAEELVALAIASSPKPRRVAEDGVPMSPTPTPVQPGSDDQMRRAGLHITNYLKSINKRMVSFERIRERVNREYSDALLLELVDQSPERFRRARLKGGKPGMALV